MKPPSATHAKVLTGTIHVCPMHEVPAVLDRTGARHLVTVINEQMMLPTPAGLGPDRHLRLAFNDIIAPQPGMICPAAGHIEALIGFIGRWNHDGPLLIHCLAGVSRSPAAAFIALCTLNPDVPELVLASRLRLASPTAIPNSLMIELADEALDRQGRMIEAIERIGSGEILAGEVLPFSIASRQA